MDGGDVDQGAVECGLFNIWGFETYKLYLKSRNHALLEDKGGGVWVGEDMLCAIVGMQIDGTHGGRDPLCSIHELPILSGKYIIAEFE